MASPTSALIGRDAELDALADAFVDACAGHPRTVAIAGEAGIGKTRLLNEFVERHSDDARVLIGRCIDLGGSGAAYTSIAAALRPLIAELGADEVRRIAGGGLHALQGLFPQLGGDGPPGGQVGGLHESIALLLEAVSAERPVILAIEDLHWIDPASLAVLRFLARGLPDARVLLLVTYRAEDVHRGHLARPFVADIARDRAATRIDLPRLDRDGTRRLMRELLGAAPSDASVDALLERTEGVPFYIEELADLQACAEDATTLPDGLRDLLLVRYEWLTDDARRIVRHIAVGGIDVDHDMLAAVFDGTAAELELLIREAVTAAVILATPTGYAFRHALVREAILDDVLPGERERLHERYAQEYEARAQAGASVAAAIAHHWAGARDTAKAFGASLRAMREARAAMGYASAAQHAERALSLWSVVPDAENVAGMHRLELMGRTATYLRNAGDVDRSLAILSAALRECEPGTFDHALLLNNQGRGLAIAARPASIESYRDALATLDALGEGRAIDTLRADVMISLAGRLMLIGEDRESLALATEGATLAHRLGATRLESVGINIVALCHGHLGRVDEARAGLERAREVANDDGPALLRYWVNASDLAQNLGDYPRSLAIAREGLAGARRLGAERTSGVVLASNLLDSLIALGHWDEAGDVLERYLAIAPTTTGRSYLVRDRALIQVLRGDAAGAHETLEAGRSLFTSTSAFELQSRLTVAHVSTEVALALGDDARAWREAQALLAADPERLHPGHVPPFAWTVARVIGRAARAPVESVDVAAAAMQLREVVDLFSWWPTHEAWRPLIEGELAPSVETLERAVAASTDARVPGHVRPRALLRLAEALRDAGDRAAARERVEEALDSAQTFGAIAAREETLAFGRSAGLLRASASRAAHGLTERERQVVELVAAGLSNKQIGERLFISGKTASVHVSAILRKLGAANRAEAAHLARDLVSS
ncbi:helix-turn-helix transcriptional regulator [Microbacterium sp. JZ31]|uniref:helix-turn-helix transcriptional regulator n=1 Tax=Microbacterium sp. JZ31 TaxID=1906274 RepID=UPI0019319E45|nr:AAA family ATPase [Microbacterium sp. JZ31]